MTFIEKHNAVLRGTMYFHKARTWWRNSNKYHIITRENSRHSNSSPTSSTILEKSELEAGRQRVRISCFHRADRRAAVKDIEPAVQRTL